MRLVKQICAPAACPFFLIYAVIVRAQVCKIYSIHNIRLHERLINAIQYMTKGDFKEWDKTAPVSFFHVTTFATRQIVYI